MNDWRGAQPEPVECVHQAVLGRTGNDELGVVEQCLRRTLDDDTDARVRDHLDIVVAVADGDDLRSRGPQVLGDPSHAGRFVDAAQVDLSGAAAHALHRDLDRGDGRSDQFGQ